MKSDRCHTSNQALLHPVGGCTWARFGLPKRETPDPSTACVTTVSTQGGARQPQVRSTHTHIGHVHGVADQLLDESRLHAWKTGIREQGVLVSGSFRSVQSCSLINARPRNGGLLGPTLYYRIGFGVWLGGLTFSISLAISRHACDSCGILTRLLHHGQTAGHVPRPSVRSASNARGSGLSDSAVMNDDDRQSSEGRRTGRPCMGTGVLSLRACKLPPPQGMAEGQRYVACVFMISQLPCPPCVVCHPCSLVCLPVRETHLFIVLSTSALFCMQPATLIVAACRRRQQQQQHDHVK